MFARALHDGKVPLHLGQRGGQHHQAAVIQHGLHQHPWQAANAQRLHHTACNGFRAAQRGRGPQLLQAGQQGMLHHLSRARALFAQQPARLAQHPYPNRLALRRMHQRIAGGSHNHQLILDPGLHLQPTPVAAAFNQANISLQQLHGLCHLARIADAHIHADVRVAAGQRRQHRGQNVAAHRGTGRHKQAHRQTSTAIAQRLLQASGLLQQRQRLRQQGTPCIVEHQTAAHALKQQGV